MDFDAPVESADLAEKSEGPQVFSISDLNRAIKSMLEKGFRQIWLQGEISNFKPHSSGHFYFNLKDSKAMISAVMFRGSNSALKFKPHDGLEVIVRGNISLYEPRGSYQIICDSMEPVGAGALQVAFEQLKKKLELEGLFEQARKRPIPSLPKHVAVVTSPTGAAIRDILNILGRRFAGLRVTVVPAVVQGDKAPDSIVNGIVLAQKLDIDVMIVGRGGGSIEDMWGFNDEWVARALAAARVPVISAVGHEIDFTIADFVADLRAPTPSAAAELVCKNAGEIADVINVLKKRLWRCWTHRLQIAQKSLTHATQRLVDPKRRLQDLALRCDELSQRLEAGINRELQRRQQWVQLAFTRLISPREVILRLHQKIEMLGARMQSHVGRTLDMKRSRWAQLSSLLDSLSPLKVVERGYSITFKDKKPVKSVAQITKGDLLEITFAKGKAAARVETILEP